MHIKLSLLSTHTGALTQTHHSINCFLLQWTSYLRNTMIIHTEKQISYLGQILGIRNQVSLLMYMGSLFEWPADCFCIKFFQLLAYILKEQHMRPKKGKSPFTGKNFIPCLFLRLKTHWDEGVKTSIIQSC